ncbi:MAG: hypothetical protein R2844_16225 [Caldilineales bacterium]
MNTRRRSKPLVTLALALVALLTLAGAAAASGPQQTEQAAPPPASGDSNRGFSFNFHYEYVSGSALRPRDSSSGWDYSGTGCVSRSSGSELFNINLSLPEGSRIDYLRIYYYDTSGSNDSRAWITTYNASGGYSDITTVTSTGSGGYGTRLSSYLGHIVDNASNSYVLNWNANQNGSGMRLCGLRVAYRTPTQDLFLPLIAKG